MKAFYIIHILALAEIIAAVLIVSKLQDLRKKTKILQSDLRQKTDINLENLQKLKDLCHCFNDKYINKSKITFDFIKKILTDVLINGLIGRLFFAKKPFLPKIIKGSNILFWFVLSFLLFRGKNA